MKTFLGIEFGSTRIKAIQVDEQYRPLINSDYSWKSDYIDGIWTYRLDEAWSGLKEVLSKINDRESVTAVGISAMMHGYLAFDQDWQLLTPFRTWQNTVTSEAAEKLTALFGFNIPQRWSIAHLYQAILNGESHVKQLKHITTLAGYIHFMLTGENVIGIGDASGMFPIDSVSLDYDAAMIQKFDALAVLPESLRSYLPKVLTAGAYAGKLTKRGEVLMDHLLPAGIPLAPPEGDAGTGMTATNSVAERTGNVSAGTSIFSMVVLEQPLKKVYSEIDMVTTPAGKPVAMVHCNNCTSDMNDWAKLLGEAAALFGMQPDTETLYSKLYEKSLEGAADCDGITVINYLAGEGVTHFDMGCPLVLRKPEGRLSLANFLRASLYSTIATLKIGVDILADEHVEVDSLTGHGGLFKTPGVGQRYMAAACRAPVTVMQTAGEGGPYGMALLSAYEVEKAENETLESWLNTHIFSSTKGVTLRPVDADIEGFERYMKRFTRALAVEQAAVKVY